MTPSITLREDIRLINLAFESERMAIPKAKFIGEDIGGPRSCASTLEAGS